MNAHVALALLALGPAATGTRAPASRAGADQRSQQARPSPEQVPGDVGSAIAALAAQFRAASLGR